MKGFAPLHRLWWGMVTLAGLFMLKKMAGAPSLRQRLFWVAVTWLCIIPIAVPGWAMRLDILASEWFGLLDRRQAFQFLLPISPAAYQDLVEG